MSSVLSDNPTIEARAAPAVEQTVAEYLEAVHAASGAALVGDNLAAFALRALSARGARRTLDVQYYRWQGDVTGRLLVHELLHAADRGVRVRLLLDDIYVLGAEPYIAALDAHPLMEIRLFNAFEWRGWGRLAIVEILLRNNRLNHRMHNKAWIADGCLAVVGGRNIGDEYFGAGSEIDFRDLDLAIVGAGAGQAVAAFERYWDSPLTHRVDSIRGVKPLPGGLPALHARLASDDERTAARPYLQKLAASPAVAALLDDEHDGVAVNEVRIVTDAPEKARGEPGCNDVLPAITAALEAATRTVILISPYFVPGREGSALLLRLRARGVEIRVLTNSLVATDVTAVHGGYARYRKPLLAAGVVIHELKRAMSTERSLFGSSGASLHTKALVVDDDLIFVGSFNLDQRSANLNTEMGGFVRHASLAGELREECARLAAPEASYHVMLEGKQLVWRDRIGGRDRVSRKEPDASLWRRLAATIVGWLPLEAQL